MTPFGFDDDEWLAAQYLLFFDETGDEAEARRRVEQLRNQRSLRLQNPHPLRPPDPPPIAPPPPPRASRRPGVWQRLFGWLRG
jgi:hypothetical protein